MALHELIDRHVPGPPVRPYRRTVPPLAVKLPVAKAHHLRQSIETGLEHGEETCKPDNQRNGRELHHPLDDGRPVQDRNLVERVAENRRGILRRRKPDEHA